MFQEVSTSVYFLLISLNNDMGGVKGGWGRGEETHLDYLWKKEVKE